MQVAEHVNQNEKILITLKHNILKHLFPNKNIISPNRSTVSFKLFAEYHLVSSRKLENGVTPSSLALHLSAIAFWQPAAGFYHSHTTVVNKSATVDTAEVGRVVFWIWPDLDMLKMEVPVSNKPT